ncbi:type II secretion system protein [Viridibacterium curvum]|uniref:Type II secretion system protein n=1 Tax=Viridibacterium curvum TaxID=1101404 RepID=A0ABP9QL06_9RHOO
MVYLLLIFTLATLGFLLAELGRGWSLTAQRAKETELLFIGQQFAQALSSYKARTPQGTPEAPQRLEDLLEDRRFPFIVRHLREIPRDPMTGLRDWGLALQDGRIVAVHSLSERQPLRQGMLPEYVSVKNEEGRAYRKWFFVPVAASPGPGIGATSGENPQQ